MKNSQPSTVTSVVAAEDLTNKANYFIGFDGKVCGLDKFPLGVLIQGTPQGELAPVVTSGVCIVFVNSIEIQKGAAISVEVDGSARPQEDGPAVGYAMDHAPEDIACNIRMRLLGYPVNQ